MLFCCGRASAEGPEEYKNLDVEVIPDVPYDHKYALAMTFDVLKPRKNANGAGILVIISGGWHFVWFYPETALGGTYSGWFDGRRLLSKGFTIFLVRHGSGRGSLCPRSSTTFAGPCVSSRHPKRFGVDPDRLGVCGGDVPGHLSLMLGNSADDGVPDPPHWDWRLRYSDAVAAVVAYYPPTDIRPWFKTDRWKNWEAMKFDRAGGAVFAAGPGQSPAARATLLLHGDKDPGIPIEHSKNILAELKKNNVPCE